ncbi:MAG: hypothetical protein J6S82_07245, partial [Bacteroidales bacterium]|nr:hypothetical protein [Bacteroidales bacterium]
MQLIGEILKHRSCSIVGMEKNTGKTECLNFILRHIPEEKRVALTSIGIDGEQQDQVTRTHKPEISLRPGMLFATSESHYRQKQLSAEVLQISGERTSLGNVVIARDITAGKIMLSGPASAAGLRRWMREMEAWKADITLIDGALSRKSSASPAVSEAMVLTTGAAYSADMQTLVQHTAFVAELVHLPMADEAERQLFDSEESGIWVKCREGDDADLRPSDSVLIQTSSANSDAAGANEGGTKDGADELRKNGAWRLLPVTSSLHLRNFQWNSLPEVSCLYLSGALTDTVLELMQKEPVLKNADLLVRDFTKIFVSPLQYRLFIKNGRQIKVLQQTKLIAVCVNPVAPNGFVL